MGISAQMPAEVQLSDAILDLMRITVGVLVAAAILIFVVWQSPRDPQFDARGILIEIILGAAGILWFALQVLAAVRRQKYRRRDEDE